MHPESDTHFPHLAEIHRGILDFFRLNQRLLAGHNDSGRFLTMHFLGFGNHGLN